MKLCKFIVTLKCDRSCSFCLNKNLSPERFPEELSLDALMHPLQTLKNHGYEGIMLSGGEPLLSPLLAPKIAFCVTVFSGNVYLTTSHPTFLYLPLARTLKEIVLSLHDGISEAPKVPPELRVFGSIMASQYEVFAERILLDRGYSGLTINEDKFGSEIFDENLLYSKEWRSYNSFSIKINRRDYCVNDRHFLMPNYEILTDFSVFLTQTPELPKEGGAYELIRKAIP
jgi:hypothetical protein